MMLEAILVMMPVGVLLLLLKASRSIQNVQHAQASSQCHEQHNQQDDDLKKSHLQNMSNTQHLARQRDL